MAEKTCCRLFTCSALAALGLSMPIADRLIPEATAQDIDPALLQQLLDSIEDGSFALPQALIPDGLRVDLTFVLAPLRVDATSESTDSPVDERFSIRIVPDDTGGLVPIQCREAFGFPFDTDDVCWVASEAQAGMTRVPCVAEAAPRSATAADR